MGYPKKLFFFFAGAAGVFAALPDAWPITRVEGPGPEWIAACGGLDVRAHARVNDWFAEARNLSWLSGAGRARVTGYSDVLYRETDDGLPRLPGATRPPRPAPVDFTDGFRRLYDRGARAPAGSAKRREYEDHATNYADLLERRAIDAFQARLGITCRPVRVRDADWRHEGSCGTGADAFEYAVRLSGGAPYLTICGPWTLLAIVPASGSAPRYETNTRLCLDHNLATDGVSSTVQLQVTSTKDGDSRTASGPYPSILALVRQAEIGSDCRAAIETGLPDRVSSDRVSSDRDSGVPPNVDVVDPAVLSGAVVPAR